VPTDAADGLQQTLLTLTPEQRMRVAPYEVQRGDTLASIAKQSDTTAELLRHLNNFDVNEKPVIGSTLMVPSAAIDLPEKALRAAALVDRPQRAGRRSSRHGMHVVRRGDTLYGIAHRLGTDVNTLARLNNMDVSDPLRAGQRLVISDKAARTRSSASHGTSNSSAAPPAGRQITYTVRPGDTLYGIARLLQVTLHDLLGWNDMTAGSSIRPGQKLVAFVSSHG